VIFSGFNTQPALAEAASSHGGLLIMAYLALKGEQSRFSKKTFTTLLYLYSQGRCPEMLLLARGRRPLLSLSNFFSNFYLPF
jgi:hypothetical protein